MDIWDWVTRARRQLRSEGHVRLAELVEALPSAVCENAHARVDAIYPEALALARAAGNPWLEVFVRHWNLQSRILHRHEVAEWMGEAVSLVEFASRDEARGCPQSVCVTQDLVNCYGNSDGPGFAAERVAAAEETLARIDARWPCFRCIGGELVEALLDAGDAPGALRRLDAMEAAIHKVEGRMERFPMGESRVAILRRLGRFEEALALVDALDDEAYADDDSRLERELERAWLLSLLERPEEAFEVLPPFEALGGTHSMYPPWGAVTVRLARQGVVANDGWLDRRLRGMGEELWRIGAVRHALELMVERGLLAVARGRRGTALACLAAVDGLLPRLRRPLDAAEKRAGLAAAVAGMGAVAVALGDDVEAVLGGLSGDPEADSEVLDAAAARWPDSEAVALRRAEALAVGGDRAGSEAALRGWLAGHPASAGGRVLLAQRLIERGALDEAGALAEGLRGEAAPWGMAGRALRVQVAQARGDGAEARRLLRAEVAAAPEDTELAMALATMLGEAGERAEALAVLDGVAARSGPGRWDVWRLIHGTLLDRWETVRDAAARLGWRLPGEGAVAGSYELVRLRIEEADGEASEVWARRTGPVSAQVLTMAGPGRPQHYLDEVVFDLRPIEEGAGADEDDEGDEGERAALYGAVAIKRRGGMVVYAVDGVHPGEDELDELLVALEEMGAEARVMSGPDYALSDPASGEARRGVYVFVAIAPARARALDAALSTFAERWGVPVVWPELLEALGVKKRLRAQHALMEAWGM